MTRQMMISLGGRPHAECCSMPSAYRENSYNCRWQSEMKCRSFPRVGRCPHTSSVRLNNRTTDRQPHAAAFWFRRKEGIKNAVCFVGGQSDTRIADRDLNLVVLPELHLDRKYSTCLLHRLDTIEHEVHEHLLQLYTICDDCGEPFGNVGTDVYEMPIRLVAQHKQHLSYDFAYLNCVHLRTTLPVQGADTVDDVGRTPGIFRR